MASVDIKVNLITKAAELQLQQLGRTASQTSQQFNKFQGNVKGFGGDLATSFRQGSLALGQFGTLIRAGAVGAGLFGLIGVVKKSVTEFAEFEKALIGIGKVANVDGIELQQLGKQFQELSFRVPLATNELIGLGEEAARLGIRGTANLLKFSEVAARLAVSTNVSGRDAVTALTRIINVTGDSVNNIDRLGSALVDLGNNFATSEADILEGARVLSQRTAGFGLAAKDILAISTALKDAGAPSESSASAIQTFFTVVTREAAKGSDKFRDFATIIGVTEEELKKKLAEDALGTLQSFVQGLSNAEKAGGNVVAALDKLGLAEKRTSGAFRTLVANNDRFINSVERTNQAYIKNSALTEESQKAFKSTSSALTILGNTFDTIFTNLGQANSGVINSFIQALNDLAKFAANATNPIKDLDQQLADLTVKQFDLNEELQRLKNAPLIADAYSGAKTAADDIAQIKLQLVELGKEEARLENQRDAIRKNQIENETKNTVEAGKLKLQATRENNIKLLEAEIAHNAALIELENFNQESSREQNLIKLSETQQSLNERLLAEKEYAANSIENEKDRKEATLKILKDQAIQAKIYKEQEVQLERNAAQARVNILGNLGNLVNSIAGQQTKAGFLLSKAAAAGQVILADSQAKAAASAAAAIASIAAPPGTNLAVFKANQAAYNSLISINTGISLAAIAASAIKGFQDGGVVGGSSFSGDKVLARVNSGEMILNRQQQAQLFAQANGRTSGGGSQEVVVHTTVELDGAAVAKAVSRQVNNGTELGSLI